MTTEEKLQTIVDFGYDPQQYDFDEQSNTIKKKVSTNPTSQVERPSLNPAITTATPVQDKQTPLQSAGIMAGRNLWPAFEGLGIAAGAQAGLKALGMVPTPLTKVASFAGPLVAGMAAAAGTAWGQEPLLEKGPLSKERAQQALEQNKKSALVGSVLPNLMAFSPALGLGGQAGLVSAGRSAGRLAGGKVLTDLERANLGSVALGASLPVATEVATDLYHDQPLDPTSLLINALAGGLVSNPNRVGQKAFGFEPITGQVIPNSLREQPGVLKGRGYKETIKEEIPSTVEESRGVLPQTIEELIKLRQLEQQVKNFPQKNILELPEGESNAIANANPQKRVIEKGTLLPNKPVIETLAPKDTKSIPLNEASKVADIVNQAEIRSTMGANEPQRNTLIEAGQKVDKINDYDLALREKQAAEQELAEIKTFQLKRDAEILRQQAQEEKAKMISQSQQIPPVQPKNKQYVEPTVSTDLRQLQKVMQKNTISTEEAKYQSTKPQATIEEVLGNTPAKVEEVPVVKPVKLAMMPEKGRVPLDKTTEVTSGIPDGLVKAMKQLGLYRGVQVDVTTKRLYTPDGLEINGKAWKENATRKVLASLSDPKNTDTLPHEIFHHFYDDIKASSNPREQKLAARLESVVADSPEYLSYKQRNPRVTPEEYLTQRVGEKTIDLIRNGDKSLFKDVVSNLKVKLLSKPGLKDVDRYFSTKLLEDAPYKETYGRTTDTVAKPNTLSKEDEAKKQEGSQEKSSKEEDYKKFQEIEQKKQELMQDNRVFNEEGEFTEEFNELWKESEAIKNRNGGKVPEKMQDAGQEKALNRNPQEDTPEFKKWFGDSKVVDKDGKPLVVYHGTNKDFNKFERNDPAYSKWNKENSEMSKEGFFFTPSKDLANYYSIVESKTGANIQPVYLKANKLLVKEGNPASLEEVRFAKKEGYEGVFNKFLNEYIVFNPEQIKSATGNKGTFDPANPDIRHQPKNQEKILDNETVESNPSGEKYGFFKFLEGSNDKVKAQHDEQLGSALNRVANEKDSLLGQYRNTAQDIISHYSQQELDNVIAYRRSKFRQIEGDAPELSPKEQQLNEELSPLFSGIRDEQIKSKLEVRGREAGKNEDYVPDMMSEKALRVFTKAPTSSESYRFQEDWINHLVDNGISEKEAPKIVKDYLRALSTDHKTTTEFNALRKPMGFGLPESLREMNGAKLISKYFSRAAGDLAFFKHVESQPEIAKKLETFGGTPEVKASMRWLLGDFTNQNKLTERVNAASRVVNNSLMGVATGVRDVANIVALTTPYIQGSKELAAYGKAFSNWSKTKREALKTNAIRHNLDLMQWNNVESNSSEALDKVHQLADLMRKYQGRELLEQSGRIYTFGLGEELTKLNLDRHFSGDKKGTDFLEKFSGDGLIKVDKLASPEDVTPEMISQFAKHFVDRVQGSYDGRGLPAEINEGPLAPFFALSKWSVEKSNVIYKDVVKPMQKGDYKPFLLYTLGTVLTGAGIRELNELMSNKKDQNASLKEATEAGNTLDQTAAIINLMQQGSYAGIVGDSIKALSDVAINKQLPRGLSFPLMDFTTETLAKNFADYGAAIEQGEDPKEAAQLLVQEILRSTIQNWRLASNQMSDKEMDRKDKYRDVRVFNQLKEGRTSSTYAAPNPFINSKEKAFKREDNLEKSVEQLTSILKDYATKYANDPAKLKRKLESLKQNSYQIMPSMEADLPKFVSYYEYVKKTQGEDKAKALVKQFVEQNEKNRIKSSLVPDL